MRLYLFILGVFAALICIAKPAAAQRLSVVRLLRYWRRWGRWCHELRVGNA
jgi:hypothetical protein